MCFCLVVRVCLPHIRIDWIRSRLGAKPTNIMLILVQQFKHVGAENLTSVCPVRIISTNSELRVPLSLLNDWSVACTVCVQWADGTIVPDSDIGIANHKSACSFVQRAKHRLRARQTKSLRRGCCLSSTYTPIKKMCTILHAFPFLLPVLFITITWRRAWHSQWSL